MYEAPIQLAMTDLQSELNTDIENNVMLILKQHYNISVDKDELLRALDYHRFQYKKGYSDGQNDIFNELIEAKESGKTLSEFIEERWS